MSFEEQVANICHQTNFNGKVLIAKGHDILFDSGFGYADIEAKTPFTEHSIFRIDSITKQFTAVSVLQLVDQGLLKLTDTIDHFIDGVTYDHAITIHHLLSNSSGIPNFDIHGDYDHLLASDSFHENMIKDVILKKPLNFMPGERFEYSSSGFFILTHIIEVVSKMPYHLYVKSHIFDVLGMNHSGFDFIDQKVPGFVSLYDMKDDQIVKAIAYDMRKASGAGGLYSSTKDLFLYGKGLINNQLISKKLVDLMFDVQTPINQQGGYGYGVVSITFDNNNVTHEEIYHPGNGPGVFAQMMIIDRDIQIIVLSNVNDKNTFHACFNQIEELVQTRFL